MFSKLTLFVASAFALGVLAAPGGPPAGNACATGTLNCCDNVQNANSSAVQSLLPGLVGAALGGLTGQVGINCSPLGVVNVGGNNCAAQTACCSDNTFNGIITLACNPINIGL